jgi:hypothetical protein
MITYLKRKDLNIEKYNACLEKSIQSRIYGFSWYLDIVADNWDALVLDDYVAVMPLPWKQKFFLKYVAQPYFCQQLGIFSKTSLSMKTQEEFIKMIPSKFVKVALSFNAGNFFNLKMTKKDNYILKLDKDITETINLFNKNRKRDYKKGTSSSFTFDKNVDSTEFLKFYLKHDQNYQEIKGLTDVLQKITTSKKSEIKYFGLRKDDVLMSCALILVGEKRVTYLAPVSNNFAKKNGGATFLLAEIFNLYVGKKYVFDFEGSMVKGVANFYKSFGAEKENYYFLK